MAISIVDYLPDHVKRVAAFNERMRAHSGPFGLPSQPLSAWLPKLEGSPIYLETFLAVDANEVRGGYTLRRQDFWLNGNVVSAANYQGPISEGIYDRSCMMVGVQMLRSALRKSPLLYALGMGGLSQPLPQLLQASGWSLILVPFHYRVLRPCRFLRSMPVLHRTLPRSFAARVAACSGAGWLGIHLYHFLRRRKPSSKDCSVAAVREFGSWADDVWTAARGELAFSAVRNRSALNCEFPETDTKDINLHVTRNGATVGWAVVRNTPMKGNKYFGDLQLGSLVDCLAIPGEELAVVDCAMDYLKNAGAELLITNQTHQHWNNALRDAGFLTGPSNFVLACSPKLIEAAGPLEESLKKMHFNRADGDGPIHI